MLNCQYYYRKCDNFLYVIQKLQYLGEYRYIGSIYTAYQTKGFSCLDLNSSKFKLEDIRTGGFGKNCWEQFSAWFYLKKSKGNSLLNCIY